MGADLGYMARTAGLLAVVPSSRAEVRWMMRKIWNVPCPKVFLKSTKGAWDGAKEITMLQLRAWEEAFS
jgi:hypothetical protein